MEESAFSEYEQLSEGAGHSFALISRDLQGESKSRVVFYLGIRRTPPVGFNGSCSGDVDCNHCVSRWYRGRLENVAGRGAVDY